ncbi:MAG: MlaA family lipoprotein [Rhodanobacteraceae bacterium]
MSRIGRRVVQRVIIACLVGTLAACAVAPPRSDDPLQKFNRKMFAFNRFADKVAVRPVAKAYVKVTGNRERELISNFFANIRTPITVVNEVLQGRPKPALESALRFTINTTVGLLGFFDPASRLELPAHPTDFGVTLAHWGLPEGPYLVLPLIGPTTARDVWSLPVDNYFDPMGWFAREHSYAWDAQYAPQVFYLVTVRAAALPFEPIIDSAFDPYAFVRDAYRQHRLDLIYYGNPPLSAIEELQGTTPTQQNQESLERLLEQQKAYEKSHGANPRGVPAPAGSSAPPAAASSAAIPATPSSTQPAPGGSAG